MSARLSTHAFDEAARKWRALAELRLAHLTELFNSGRWKHYYDEKQFFDRMYEVVRQCERWAEIAPRPEDSASEKAVSDLPRRTAA
jgi:uncharacterized repeat protein (TIGR03809 family)